MASDLRLIDAPLEKAACAYCGALRNLKPQTVLALFERGYALYAHAPGGSAERERQDAYAGWITSSVPHAPERVLDAGCGNGSLLLALAKHWPAATLLGCDLSADSISFGGAAGLTLWASPVLELPPEVHADLIVTVNVIEHTPDPLAFLADLRARL